METTKTLPAAYKQKKREESIDCCRENFSIDMARSRLEMGAKWASVPAPW